MGGLWRGGMAAGAALVDDGESEDRAREPVSGGVT